MKRPNSSQSLTNQLSNCTPNFPSIARNFVLQPSISVYVPPPKPGRFRKIPRASQAVSKTPCFPEQVQIQPHVKTMDSPIYRGQFRMPKKPTVEHCQPLFRNSSEAKFKKLNMSNSSSCSINTLENFSKIGFLNSNTLLTLDENLITLEIDDSE